MTHSYLHDAAAKMDAAEREADALVRQPGFHKVEARFIRLGDIVATNKRGDYPGTVESMTWGDTSVYIAYEERARIRPRGTTKLWVHRPS